MERFVAPVTVQASVEEPPEVTVDGVAVNEEITGAAIPPPVLSVADPPHAVTSRKSATETAVESPLLVIYRHSTCSTSMSLPSAEFVPSAPSLAPDEARNPVSRGRGA
jgi:hypothetical protein